MFDLIFGKFKTVIVPEILAALKAAWTPQIEDQLKQVLVQFLQNAAAQSPNKIDGIAIDAISGLIGLASSSTQPPQA